jgi:thermitase
LYLRKTTIALAIAILLISSFPTIVFAAPSDNAAPVSDFSSQEILVKFKPHVTLPEVAQIHRQLGGQAKETIPGIGVQVVTVPKGQAKAKAKAYSSNPRVAYAEPNCIAQALAEPDDKYFGAQWNMQKVRVPEAWNVTTGSPNVIIAILDTGVDLDHPDLANKIVDNRNFTTSNTTDDIYGHGTHVAGIAAAITNNGIGVTGLGYSSSITNVKVLGDDGMGYWSWIAQGIIWAADNGAEVINLSLGGSDASSTLEGAINYAWSKGVVVVAAAGNNGNMVPVYPAYYANCIAVAATDASDARPLWSNYGDWVDVAAPGSGILSTFKNDNYVYMSGTSVATPHVAGLAALVFTTVSDTNGDGKLNDEVRSRIEATCDDIGVTGIGYGRINAAQAVGDVAPVLPGRISGQVTDAQNGSPIVGAAVSDGTRTTTTDTAGTYAIVDVPPGAYQVIASREGYQSSSLTVTVLSGTTGAANFSLSQIIVPGSITGSVIDARDGLPIVGTTVSDGTRTALTDGAGTYTINSVPPGSCQVVASKEGYETSSSTVNVLQGTTALANFSLSQIIVPGSISGSVTSAKDGSPIVGAMVSDGTRTTTTDATGRYTIVNLPAGAYQVTASKAGYHSSSLTVSVLSGGTAVADFSLNEVIVPGSISGTVTSAKDGSPLVGATVTDGTRTTTTDATGKYTIANVPSGTYEATASKSGYHSSSLTVAVLSGGTVVANFLLNEVILPGSIAGSVTSAKDGSAIVGATVTDGTRMTTTDATGKYAISNVPPGTYQVIASKAGYYSFSSSVTVVAGSTTVANFALAEIPGSIAGTVTSAKDGSPLVGATVTDGTRTTTTDGTGKYTIANVPPGTYQVTASKAGYQSSSVTVMVVAGNTVVANFSLSETPGAITGTLTSAKDGSVIAGATVTDGTRTTTTDATGKYTISNVPPGTYQAVASKSGYHSSSLSVTVLAGSTAVANFALNEVIVPGSISGTVTSAKDGSAIAGATVTDGTRTTTTDAMGKYTISNVMPGTYQVTASKEGYVSVTSAVTVVSGGTVTINFSLSPRTPAMWVDSIGFIKSGKNLFIQVRVVTASGVVPGATVGLSLECTSGGVWSFSSTTDTAGLVKFKLSKAPIGNYLTAVNSLTRSGFLWDTSKGTTATGYALSG